MINPLSFPLAGLDWDAFDTHDYRMKNQPFSFPYVRPDKQALRPLEDFLVVTEVDAIALDDDEPLIATVLGNFTDELLELMYYPSMARGPRLR